MEEVLNKKCPRCGKASANPNNPAGRCRKHLNQLKRNKKTPGHWQRAQTKFDDAMRRQNGANGTANYKSKGRATSRKKFVRNFQRAEKRVGQKLSPDRKNNSRGYESKNIRYVPEHLNRGRHSVDAKKLAAWKKRLKKTNLSPEDFATILVIKYFPEELSSKQQTLAKSLALLLRD
jgi:hypothetical protein